MKKREMDFGERLYLLSLEYDTKKELYESMGISSSTFYRYLKREDAPNSKVASKVKRSVSIREGIYERKRVEKINEDVTDSAKAGFFDLLNYFESGNRKGLSLVLDELEKFRNKDKKHLVLTFGVQRVGEFEYSDTKSIRVDNFQNAESQMWEIFRDLTIDSADVVELVGVS